MKPPDHSTDRDSPALDWPRRAGRVDAVLRELEARTARRRRRWIAAGSAAAIAVGAILFWRVPASKSDGISAASASTVAVIRPGRQVLPDGSVMELRDDARVEAAFADDVRRLVLRQGEVHFQVARQPARPFVVDIGGLQVRAIGTAFSVRPGDGTFEVIVSEGRVAVDDNQPVPSGVRTLAFVDAGSRAVVHAGNRTTEISVIPKNRMEEELAWRATRLEFTGTPLREAVETFNRYNSTRLSVPDPATGELRLSGIVRADSVDALLRLLEINYGISAERTGDRAILRR